jgi:hypothetical protein
MGVRTAESSKGIFRRRYQLVASLDGREVEPIIQQLRDFVPEFRAWKNHRETKAQKVIFAIVAALAIHPDLRQALQHVCRDREFATLFQSLTVEFAIMDEYGWLRDKFAFVGVDPPLQSIGHFDSRQWFGPFTEELKK